MKVPFRPSGWREQEVPHPLSYDDPQTYYQYVRSYNESFHMDLNRRFRQAEVCRAIRERLNDLGFPEVLSVGLMTPGSDGRKERCPFHFDHPTSPAEITAGLLLNEKIQIQEPETPIVGKNNTFAYIREHLARIIRETSIELRPLIQECIGDYNILSAIDAKVMSNYSMVFGSSVAAHQGDEGNLQVTRVFDCETLHDEQYASEAYMRGLLVSQMCFNEHLRTAIYKAEKKRLDDEKRITRQGKNRIRQQDRVHVDWQEGAVHYDPENMTSSFKIGQLRLVQRLAVLRTLQILTPLAEENSPESREKMLRIAVVDLPHSTVRKLEYLHENGLLPPKFGKGQLEELQYLYMRFLQEYHASEYAYGRDADTVRSIDSNTLAELKEMNEGLLCLVQEART